MRIWPRTLAGQLVVGILLAMAAAQFATFAIFTDERRLAVRAAARTQVLQRSAAVFRLLENAPRDMAMRIAVESSDEWIQFSVTEISAVVADGDRSRDRALRHRFRRYLGPNAADIRMEVDQFRSFFERFLIAPFSKKGGGKGRRPTVGLTLSIGLRDGGWLNVRTLVAPPPPGWAFASLSMAAGTAIVLVVIVFVLVRRVTRPLARLADAADRLGRGGDIGPLPVEGPVDVRRTTLAFNAMQERQRRFVRDRTQMLAAISHDLRTPITSIRLRAEFVEDSELREKIIATLAEMERMTEATLAFAREDVATEPARSVDVAALIESVAADLSEAGMDVVFESDNKIDILARPDALKRVFRNLIENAAVYGKQARLHAAVSDGEVIITVDDDGPGIPEADRERVFEPFVRLDGSRNRETGGIGLGLAIARSIVRAHGGDIALDNRPSGGLRAIVRLPLEKSG